MIFFFSDARLEGSPHGFFATESMNKFGWAHRPCVGYSSYELHHNFLRNLLINQHQNVPVVGADGGKKRMGNIDGAGAPVVELVEMKKRWIQNFFMKKIINK